MGILPASVRVQLRNAGVKKNGKSYGWDSKADLADVINKLRAGSDKPKASKPAKADKAAKVEKPAKVAKDAKPAKAEKSKAPAKKVATPKPAAKATKSDEKKAA